MSGIVAMLNTDGSPCNTDRLTELTQALVFRGPDGSATKVHGAAGLGASLFRTTDESRVESQPLSLDGRVWIVADCRVDDRATLVSALRGAGAWASLGAPDVELILRAYLAWGPRCVDRLLGDFSFLIWDGRVRTLFAARDHFGVKPFFYAHVDRLLILSNTLSCIRQHPDVPLDVNEAAIGDFLLFGVNLYPTITAFLNIRRLPAAHALSVVDGNVQIHRYWQVPEYAEPLRLRSGDVLEGFRHVMRSAVSDRLRASTAAIELSGGVDSSCVAATASALQQCNGIDLSLTAWTFDSRPLVPNDREYEIASLTTSALGMRHVRWPFGDYPVFHDDDERYALPHAEPRDLSFVSGHVDCFRAVAESSRVLLTGEGGDGVFRGQPPLTARELYRPAQWFTFAQGCLSYAVRRREPPPLGVRTAMRQLAGRAQRTPYAFPPWIEPDFVRRQGLEDRWHDKCAPNWGAGSTALRSVATDCLRENWSAILEGFDAEWSGVPLEIRHPLLDRRIVDFVLRTPSAPWFWNKDLPRRACLGRLPREIQNRRKVPLAGNLVLAALKRGDRPRAKWKSERSLHRFVRCERIPENLSSCAEIHPAHQWPLTYPVSLSLWLQTLTRGYMHEEYATARG